MTVNFIPQSTKRYPQCNIPLKTVFRDQLSEYLRKTESIQIFTISRIFEEKNYETNRSFRHHSFKYSKS